MEFKSINSMPEPKFFISHRNVQADSGWAYWVAWQIEEKYGEGTCMIQGWDFAPNANFIKAMQKGAICPFTVAIVSPNYFTSEYTEDEWTAAFKVRKLILLEVAPCEPPGLLTPIFRLRLHGIEESTARTALLEHMDRILTFAKKGRTKPEQSPSFPDIGGTVPVRPAQVRCNVPHPPVKHFVPPGVAWIPKPPLF